MNTSFQNHMMLALHAFQAGNLAVAEEKARAALVSNPRSAEALHILGVIRGLQNNHAEAEQFLRKAAEFDKKNNFIFFNLAKALSEQNKNAESIQWHKKALALDPKHAMAWLSYGKSLCELEEIDNAIKAFNQAIEINKNLAEAYTNKASCLGKQKSFEEALALHDRAIALNPSLAQAWSNRGNALNDLRRHEEALASYERSIELKPDYAEAWSNRGNALRDLRRHEEALASYERSIELKPDYAEAWSNRGNALNDLRRHEEALASYERSIELKPDFAEAWSNRGVALNDLRRHEEALASYERSIELKPDADDVLGSLVHTQMKVCDWTDLDGRCQTLESRLLAGDQASNPFPILSLFNDPPLQRQCAEIWSKNKLGFTSPLHSIGKRGRRDKIRVGYFSMDFREHPVAHLIAELIECHDRDKFEVYGFSFGVNTGDGMRKRLEGAFDIFLEVRHLSELDIARLSRDLEIDIAVDLGGYTQDSRSAIFAHRAAPIQINYLGFPGTMGVDHFDYLIGDRVTVLDANLEYFTEKVIFLPNSFQANPGRRPVGLEDSSRATYGLPDTGFVFCCFNNVWKITPEVFNLWARILKGADGSVLWLSVDSDSARLRLRSALEKFDVDGSRLAFSNRVTRETYFDQYKFTDLFLDTLPYNAGTTASDALWMGTPLVTRAGASFAGRMASGLLDVVGLPELVTYSMEEYESLAIELANNPERIAAIKKRLVDNRGSCPLFDTPLFTRHIESAYRAAYDRFQDGLPPDHIYVTA
jgi:predicted O-linked N-acetylglucosamine transferase (SPINDLY family)